MTLRRVVPLSKLVARRPLRHHLPPFSFFFHAHLDSAFRLSCDAEWQQETRGERRGAHARRVLLCLHTSARCNSTFRLIKHSWSFYVRRLCASRSSSSSPNLTLAHTLIVCTQRLSNAPQPTTTLQSRRAEGKRSHACKDGKEVYSTLTCNDLCRVRTALERARAPLVAPSASEDIF